MSLGWQRFASMLARDARDHLVAGVWASKLDIFLPLLHLVKVTLENLGNLDSQHKGPVSMLDGCLFLRVCVHVRVIVVSSPSQPVEGHADQLFLEERLEQELKIFAHASFRYWNLPEVTLSEIWVRSHHVSELLVVPLRGAFEDLLQDSDDMWVEVRLASQRVDDC